MCRQGRACRRWAGGIQIFVDGQPWAVKGEQDNLTASIRTDKPLRIATPHAVVTILGIIAVVVIPRISVSSGTAKANANTQNRSEINSAKRSPTAVNKTEGSPVQMSFGTPMYRHDRWFSSALFD